MIRLNLCDYSDAHVYVKGIITVTNTGTAAAPSNRNEKATFKNCAPFINFIREVSNSQVDDAHDIDVLMPIHNLKGYSDAIVL